MKKNYTQSTGKNNLSSTKIIFFLLALIFSINSYSQYYTQHYVAPAPWRYFSDANELVIATESVSAVSVAVKKSDGTPIITLSAIKGTPAVYRFTGSPTASGSEYYILNTVVSAAGLNITAAAPVSVNIRNIASDAISPTANADGRYIKGNASLTSFGNAGIGVSFRVGYYRDTDLGNFGNFGYTKPQYSIMAINNNTSVKINGLAVITLSAGQSYLFESNMGSLVETSGPAIVNTSAKIDRPDGCGDGTLDQVPPLSVIGNEYFIVRGEGNTKTEQTTVVATEPNTVLNIQQFTNSGALSTTLNYTLVNAGDFYTYQHGIANSAYSASRINSTKNVVVYSGTAIGCEVDITSVAPVSACGGSNFVETSRFRKYNLNGNPNLPYFGYILLKSPTDQVNINGSNIETPAGARRQLGSTGWYLIDFTNVEIGSPMTISIESLSKMTVGIVQQGGGFSMSAIFSSYTQQPDAPTFFSDNGSTGCSASATITANQGFGPYQWFLDGNAIPEAKSNTYTTTITGSYAVSSTLSCGSSVQSAPISVTICSDVTIAKVVDNVTPCVGSNVIFTITATNNGPANASGVSVTDLLPTGYAYVSSVATVGTYNNTSGNWSVGNLNKNESVVLKITAKVNASGIYKNDATINASSDSDTTNNSATATTTPRPLPVATATPASSTICTGTASNAILSSTITGTTFSWTVVQTGVTGASAGSGSNISQTLTTTGTTNGTVVYTITPTANGCAGNSITRTITVYAAPSAPTAAITQPTCSTPTGTVTVSTPSNGVGITYTIKGSNPVSSATTNTNGIFSNLVAGIYELTTTNASNCISATLPGLEILSNENAPIANGVSICVGGTGSLVANCSGNSSRWYTTATGGTPIGSGTSFNPVGVSNSGLSNTNTPGTTVFYVACGGNSGSCRTAVNFVITADPNAGILSGNQAVCVGLTTTFSSTTTGGTYTSSATGIATVNSSTGVITGVAAGTATITYTVTGTGGCVNATATRTVTVTPTNTAGTASSTPTLCISTVLTDITYATTGATGIGTATGLPAGVTAAFASNTITISGTPTVSGTFNYSIPLTGGCGAVNATGTITVTASPTAPTQSAPIQPHCSVLTGSVLLSDLPSGNWILNPGNITGNTSTKTISGLIPNTYNFTVTNSSGCISKATTNIVIYNAICAQDDTIAAGNGTSGNTNAGNILADNTSGTDTLNGAPANITLVNIEITTPATSIGGAAVPTVSTTTGQISVPAGTPAGVYTIVYNLCEKLNPLTNCDLATITVTVTPAPIVANDNTYSNINCTSLGVIGNVLTNATLNGNPAKSEEVNISLVAEENSSITLDNLGNINIQSGIITGSYVLTYQICEKLNPANCDTATITINFQDTTPPIIAQLPLASTISCSLTPNFAQALATDSCGSVALTFADLAVQGSCNGSYTITRTWTATDSSGNTVKASQVINVEDTTSPTTTTAFTPIINVNCNAIPLKPDLVFVDDCSTVAPTVVYTENTINTTATSYSIIRKWIVKDACNNTSEFIQAVNVAVVTTDIAITEIKSFNIDDIPASSINLFSLLPQGTPTSGTWFSENSSVTLNGDIVDNSSVSAGDYKFTYTINANACPTVFALTIKIEGGTVLACGNVLVHNAFSPNGDGINESFTIDNIEDTICYPENTVEIYNRWGVLVFETKNYNNQINNFNGTSRGRTSISQYSGLPTGTYFYILNYTSVNASGQVLTNKQDGYLYLTK